MTEQLVNFGETTLAEALDDTEVLVDVTDDVYPASGDFRVLVDDEIMLVTDNTYPTLTVTRGAEGTTAAAHDDGAPIKAVLTAGGLDAYLGQTRVAWFNVTGYGATGDGSTDDTTAVAAAISALNSAGRGVLYFPAGTYKTSGGFTITANCTVRGDGIADNNSASDIISEVQCTSATADLFDTPGDKVLFDNISLRNTAATTPTAGAGILVASANVDQKVDYDHIMVSGFYVNVDVTNGAAWSMRGCNISNWVSIGLMMEGTVNPDAGDPSISDNVFAQSAYDSAAAIRMDSMGGGKIIGNKFNSGTSLEMNGCIDVNGSGNTSILIITNNSFENYEGNAIDVSGAWPYIIIDGNQFGQYGNGSGTAITIAAPTDVLIANNIFVADTGSPTAVVLSGTVTRTLWGGYVNNGFATVLSGTPTYDVSQDAVGGGVHPDLSTHDVLGLATDAELAAHAATPHGLIPVDAGTPAYDDTGDGVEVTLTSVWGIAAAGVPYYDPDDAATGEEAALFWDPATSAYVLIPFDF